MPIIYDNLIKWKIPQVEQQYTIRDTILYALGVGLGSDPCDKNQLRFVYQEGLQALPTMALILGYPGRWHALPGTGITHTHTVLGEQSFTIHKPLPIEAKILGQTTVVEVIDKGAGKGAFLMTDNTIRDATSGDKICTLSSTTVCRSDGGFGGPSGPSKPVHAIPSSAPNHVCDLPTLPQAALIYRLSADYHELHVDPVYAQNAGFKMPILQGRCTFGVAGHAILKTCCQYDPTRLKSMAVRFASPVYPGETIRTEIWQDGNVISFRSTVPARGATVLNNGRAEISA